MGGCRNKDKAIIVPAGMGELVSARRGDPVFRLLLPAASEKQGKGSLYQLYPMCQMYL